MEQSKSMPQVKQYITIKLLFFVALLWILFDIWFIHTWGQGAGIGVLLFHVVLFGWRRLLNKKNSLHTRWTVFWWWMTLAALLSAWFAIFTQPTLSIINALLLIIVDVMLLMYMAWATTKIRKYIESVECYVSFFLNSIFWSISHVRESLRTVVWSMDDIVKNKKTSSIAIAVLILLLLLLIIVLPLLSQADPIFANMLDKHFYSLLEIQLDVWFWNLFRRVIAIIVTACVFLSLFVQLDKEDKDRKLILIASPNIEQVYTYVILTGVNIVYLLFIAVQFKFLFFGDHQLIVEYGLESYSSYVHRWFWQLVIIAVINFVMYLLFFGNWNHLKKARYLRVQFLFLVIATLVILASAYMRISMYVGAYGLTELRFFVFYGIFAIGLFYLYLLYHTYKQSYTYFSGYINYIFINTDDIFL